jgi:hypothetical protein
MAARLGPDEAMGAIGQQRTMIRELGRADVRRAALELLEDLGRSQ